MLRPPGPEHAELRGQMWKAQFRDSLAGLTEIAIDTT
jgi:hypothetical protein